MNVLIKTIFSKPDEMEAKISYEATKLTWMIINIIFVLAALWSLANEYSNPISLLALLLAEGIYFAVKAVLRWRITRGGKDNE